MKEVSCRAFEIFFRPLAAKGVSTECMVKGTQLSLDSLRNRKERVAWTDFLTIMANLRPHFSDDEYLDLGRKHLRGALLRFVFVVARLRLTPMGFYRWFNKPGDGAGNQLFTCITPSLREISETEVEVDLTVVDGYDPCWDFFVITKGNFEEMPRLLGFPAAKVELSPIPRGGRFHIEIPRRTPFLTRLRRALTWPFTVRAAARELQEAHETLLERYQEIDDARVKLAHQATQLRTAHTINALFQRDLDLDSTLDAVTKALVEEAGFSWAEIELVDGTLPLVVKHGPDAHQEPISCTLESRGGHVIGHVSVATTAERNRQEREEVLAFIVPTLAFGLENALYRVGLERLVEQRTGELQKAHDTLASTVVQLRDAQGARERFFANISHEIRTPLSIIMLAASDIEARAGSLLDARSRSGLGAVTESARKLVRLVDELLLLAAGQEGKLQVRPEPTDLSALIDSVIAAWLPTVEAAGLELITTVAPHLVVQIDPVAIERAVTNLVSNAVKYTPRGGSLHIELVADADHVRISVLDTGTGIDGDLASRLFGRFERAESERRRSAGTGLGLSLAKQLVEAHGGTIAAVRRPTGGTELRVILPSAVVMASQAPVTPPVHDLLAPVPADAVASGTVIPARGLSAATILLAEDDVALAEMIARVLADEYTVVIAHDGLAALELVKAHQPQLLVTDVDMPGLDGIELSKRFREITNDRLAPIIILSAVIDLGTRIEGLEAGATDYVTKPFDPRELVARVRAQLRMRELAVRLHRAEQLSSLGILTSGLAHELRNPANGVVNAVAPLSKLLPAELTHPDHPVAQLLDVVGGCAEQIGTLARQLLGFRTGAITLDLRPVKLEDLVQRAIALSQTALTGVIVRTALQIDHPVRCAPPLMVQVLANLLENAGHAVGRGGWIEVAGHVAEGRVTLEIRDSGPGVPLELRQRVFEPFFTTKAPGVGTGLGLSVSRDIVHRHGGVLEIRERDRRSVFVVELPMHSGLDATATAV